jgi:nucleotide-binding universal stress UspA family protein
MIDLKRILVPTDFSDTSEIAVNYARALAEAFNASLHVVHVIEDPLVHSWTSVDFNPDLPSYREVLAKAANERLGKVLTTADLERHHAQLVTKFGSPFIEIVRYAKEQGIDLILMGTHGRRPIKHMLMGSVAERVVRKAPCPVLTVRHPEHEFVMP